MKFFSNKIHPQGRSNLPPVKNLVMRRDSDVLKVLYFEVVGRRELPKMTWKKLKEDDIERTR